jgi:hypothetical protein
VDSIRLCTTRYHAHAEIADRDLLVGRELARRSREDLGALIEDHHAICINGLEAPMDSTDHAVLTTIEHDLLRSEVIERAIEFAIDELRGATAVERRREQILAEMRRLDAAAAGGAWSYARMRPSELQG